MKKIISIIAALTVFLGSFNYALAYSDVTNLHDNYVAITYLSEAGVIQGYDDGTFKPEKLVNRAEALKIILEGSGVDTSAEVTSSAYSDVNITDWFAKYVIGATTLGIVSGNPDGTFAPARNVARAEFMKMILLTNAFKADKWKDQKIFNDVPADAWYTPYMNYAGSAGLITPDASNNLLPGKVMPRGEVAEVMYIMTIIKHGSDIQFLITQAEEQMAQIDPYITNGKPLAAKRASELSVDMTQQAYKSMPEDPVVLGAAKLARAYDFLVNAFIEAVQENYESAEDWANQAINKATEAWEVNHDVQEIAAHIKEKANEVLEQIPE
jgi:hypothetical protein